MFKSSNKACIDYIKESVSMAKRRKIHRRLPSVLNFYHDAVKDECGCKSFKSFYRNVFVSQQESFLKSFSLSYSRKLTLSSLFIMIIIIESFFILSFLFILQNILQIWSNNMI